MLDMADVTLCGSACIRCLVRALRLGLVLRILRPSSQVRRVLEITRIDDHDHLIIEDT